MTTTKMWVPCRLVRVTLYLSGRRVARLAAMIVLHKLHFLCIVHKTDKSKRYTFDLAGTKNSSWTDRICFWRNMKIFAEIEFRQKRIIPFSCSSYFVSESYLTHNTYIFFWLSYWLVNIDSSPKLFVRFEVPPNVKVCVLDLSVLFSALFVLLCNQ